MQNARTRSLIHLHFIIFIWGFTSILGALIDLDSSAIVWFRMMVGAGSIALYFLLFSPKSFRIHPGAMKYYLLGGILISVAFFRELLGSGTIYGYQVIPDSIYSAGYQNMGLMVLSPGAFIILGLIVWVQRIASGIQEE